MSSRLEQLQAMLKDDPQDLFIRYAIAVEYAAAGDIKASILQLEELIASHPDYLGAYYKLGQLLEQNEQTARAIEVYRAGAALAERAGNKKTLREIREALWVLEDE